MSLSIGLGGATRHACVAVTSNKTVLGICEQERITRVRGAGLNPSGLPDEALNELLRRTGRRREEITACAIAEASPTPAICEPARLDHHFAHACAAFLPSPYATALIVVGDHESPQISVWQGDGDTITRVDWPWEGPGFAALYSQAAEALGFTAEGREQRLEALARLNPGQRDSAVDGFFRFQGSSVHLSPGWQTSLADLARGADQERRAGIAAAVQSRLAELLVEFLSAIRRQIPAGARLCVGGSLFFNSHVNTQVKQCGLFEEVYIPVNPGNAGLALGAAMHVSGVPRHQVPPFMGPAYTHEEIKGVLDNCKLNYGWASETETIALAVEALKKGRIVGWFDGPMEWGPRALGARSILANPFAPYVLDNLNQFLKQRDAWRGYALSGLEGAVREGFDGPDASPFMACDYAPKDRGMFRHVLPGPRASVRVHTVGSDAMPRFRALLQAFGKVADLPVLVNTSFNGFREPMVCSPRDAVRVFFGTGIDLLLFSQFVVTK